jgi:rare lipoprotein A|nr:septal ring lytic transglycosylase RlpA family protein [Sphingopyxis sp. DBS4]
MDGKREGGPAAGPTPAPLVERVSDTPVKLGDPYTIAGVTYTPVDIPDYDDVGYASWYGDELAGKPTANGETFNPDGITAAHKTLPMPSYVEVTALDTGRTILVRVNDRGPMVGDRLIDLSRGAAEQLGITGGNAAVRVRRTNPPQAERAQLRAGRAVPERIVTPDSLLAVLRKKLKDQPAPKPTPVAAQPAPPVASGKVKPGDDRLAVQPSKPALKPVPAKPTAAAGSYQVQVGAFSTEARAAAAAKSVGGTVAKAGKFWRVRVGPFASDAEARTALDKARDKGFRDAAVVRDR